MAKKAITLQANILRNDIINVEMEEDINNLVSNEESTLVSTKSQKTANSGKIYTGSGRGKYLNLKTYNTNLIQTRKMVTNLRQKDKKKQRGDQQQNN